MAADTVGEASRGVMTMEKYIKEQLPIGQRSLQYTTWEIARALTLLRTGQTEKAHLVLLLLVWAIEQYCSDQNWAAAWKLTHLTAPPLSEWKTRDSNLNQLRTDCAHTRLVRPIWAAAVIAELRDKETLTKRRRRSCSLSELAKALCSMKAVPSFSYIFFC